MWRNVLCILICTGLPSAELTFADDSAPIRTSAGLFDQQQPTTLGLTAIRGRHQHIYRATADGYKFCHHANLAAWRDRLYLMWSNGIAHEDHNGQRVLFSMTSDGLHWSRPDVLIPDCDGAGPLASVAAGWHGSHEQLVAYYTAIPEKNPGDDDRNMLFCVTSTDGKSWSAPHQLGQGFFIEGPRRLPGGRLLMNGQWPNQQPRMRFSDADDGVHGWKDAHIPQISGVFSFPEPSWFRRPDGALVAILRTKSGDPRIYASVSHDQGTRWTKPAQTEFPDATARAFAGNLPDGTSFIISNTSTTPSKSHPTIGQRTPLTIALSDDGKVFKRAYTVQNAATHMRFAGVHKVDGWQYPTALSWKRNLYIAYSINKEDVGVTRIALDDLSTSPAPSRQQSK
ncbi:MAG: exo-alpha-sialidase [Planctomycetaceae bacterium]